MNGICGPINDGEEDNRCDFHKDGAPDSDKCPGLCDVQNCDRAIYGLDDYCKEHMDSRPRTARFWIQLRMWYRSRIKEKRT